MFQFGIVRNKYPSSELVGSKRNTLTQADLGWPCFFFKKKKRNGFGGFCGNCNIAQSKKFLSLATFPFSTTASVDAVFSEACHRVPCAIRAFTVDK